MKRCLALLAALLIMLLMITACNQSDIPDSTVTTDTTAPETEPQPTTIDLVKDGVSNYTIVRGEKADAETVSAATLLRKNISEYTGVSPAIATDWIKPGDSYNPDTPEILIGRTDYAESAEALKNIPYGDYIITKIGNKLVINAWSTQALDRAISDISRQLILNATEGNFSLPGDIHMVGTVIEAANVLPLYENGTLTTIYHAGDENQLLIFEDTTVEAYDAYIKAIAANGFTLYADNEITENKFATYINDDYVINAGYYDYQKSTRVIVEPRTTLPALEADNKYETKVTPSFAMLGLEFMSGESLSQNGLCFIWQLADGSYVIVDGGFNRSIDAVNLMNYMRKHAPDPKNITIAAWIITHAHGDHHGAYYAFSESYHRQVNVELVIGNFPSDETRAAGGLESEGSGGAKVMRYVKEYHPNAQFIKAHVGQKFHLRDAEIEMLYTLESYSPRTLSYFNTSSLIFTLKIAGQQFLILGDASNDACTTAHSMYGDYLKSDFVHAAHHGYTTGSSAYLGVTSVYTAAAAPVVFWPIGEQDFAGMSGRAYSAHLQNLATTKEIIVAGSREFRVALPYTMGTSGQKTILK